MQAKKQRQDIRLRLGKGVVFLRSRGIPPVACSLIELSENGCRCIAPIKNLDQETADRWKTHTVIGKQMSIDISAPPHLPGIHLDVEIRHSSLIESGELELGISFLNVESDERELLNNALQAFAADKLGSAAPPPSPEPSDEPPKPKLTDSSIFRKQFVALAPQPAAGESAPSGTAEVKDPRKESRAVRSVKEWFTPPVSVSSVNDPYRSKKLGEILKDLGKIGDEQIAEAYSSTRSLGEKFGRYLLRSGWISPIDLCSALSLQSGLPMVDLADVEISPDLAGTFSYLTMLRHEFIPFQDTPDQLCVATSHPIPPRMIAELEQRCGKRVKVFLGEDDLIMKGLYALQPSKERKLRRQKRYKLSVPITFRFFNRQQGLVADQSYFGRTVDVSEAGFMLSTAEDLKRRGTCVHIQFSLPPENVTALCSIRYIKENHAENKKDMPWVVGLQVMDMTPEYRAQLKEICVRASMWNLKDRRESPRK
jgi:hypothetical protein